MKLFIARNLLKDNHGLTDFKIDTDFYPDYYVYKYCLDFNELWNLIDKLNIISVHIENSHIEKTMERCLILHE